MTIDAQTVLLAVLGFLGGFMFREQIKHGKLLASLIEKFSSQAEQVKTLRGKK